MCSLSVLNQEIYFEKQVNDIRKHLIIVSYSFLPFE